MSTPGDGFEPVPHDRLGYLLKHAHQALGEHTGPALAPWGINGRELAALTTLATAEAPAQNQAADRLGVDRTTMVDLIDGLQRKHLVERRPDPGDRRRNLIHLTEAGRHTMVQANIAVDEAERTFLSGLNSAEAVQFRSMLQRVLGVGQAPRATNGP